MLHIKINCINNHKLPTSTPCALQTDEQNQANGNTKSQCKSSSGWEKDRPSGPEDYQEPLNSPTISNEFLLVTEKHIGSGQSGHL